MLAGAVAGVPTPLRKPNWPVRIVARVGEHTACAQKFLDVKVKREKTSIMEDGSGAGDLDG